MLLSYIVQGSDVVSSRALVLASGCYFRSVHAGTNDRLAQV